MCDEFQSKSAIILYSILMGIAIFFYTFFAFLRISFIVFVIHRFYPQNLQFLPYIYATGILRVPPAL